MANLAQHPLQELKFIYRLLHAQLPQQPQLLDSELLQDLPTYLQQRASHESVNVSHHSQWAHWLKSNTSLKSI